MLNPDTLIAVCGYAGDAQQIKNFLPYYLHHQTPVLILSPSDSPITAREVPARPRILYASGGKRAYVGQDSLDRQIEHLKILLTRPENFFLVHDSDSICLSPELPRYLYAEPSVIWSNIVSDDMPGRDREPGYPFPHLAFQPPYFFTRAVLIKLLGVAEKTKANPLTPFLDWSMMAWSVVAGIPYKTFPDGMSCPTNADNREAVRCMREGVGIHGKIFLHSIKTREMMLAVGNDRVAFKRRNPR